MQFTNKYLAKVMRAIQRLCSHSKIFLRVNSSQWSCSLADNDSCLIVCTVNRILAPKRFALPKISRFPHPNYPREARKPKNFFPQQRPTGLHSLMVSFIYFFLIVLCGLFVLNASLWKLNAASYDLKITTS